MIRLLRILMAKDPWSGRVVLRNKEGPADDWPDQGASAADRDHDQDPSGGEPHQ